MSKFEIIYRTYKHVMFSVAMKILQNQQDAEDAVQNAFVYIFQNIHRIKSIESAKTKGFMIIVCESKAIDIYRSRKKNEIYGDEILENIAIEGDMSQLEIASCIVKLSKQYREAIILRYYYGFSISEIARIQNNTYEGTRKILSRARLKLKKMLENE